MLFRSVNLSVPTVWDVKLYRWLRGCDVSKQLTYLPTYLLNSLITCLLTY